MLTGIFGVGMFTSPSASKGIRSFFAFPLPGPDLRTEALANDHGRS